MTLRVPVSPTIEMDPARRGRDDWRTVDHDARRFRHDLRRPRRHQLLRARSRRRSAARRRRLIANREHGATRESNLSMAAVAAAARADVAAATSTSTASKATRHFNGGLVGRGRNLTLAAETAQRLRWIAPMRIVFLDFDGVLNWRFAPTSRRQRRRRCPAADHLVAEGIAVRRVERLLRRHAGSNRRVVDFLAAFTSIGRRSRGHAPREKDSR